MSLEVLGTNQQREDAVSPYMAWAKLSSAARFNLAVSGVLDYPMAELPIKSKTLQ